MEDIEIVIGGTQEHQAIKFDGVCTCLTSSMGQGGGYVPMVFDVRKVDTMYGQNTIVEQLDCCVRLGNAYNDEKFNGGNFGGNVWDTNGLAPTMKTGASASQQCVVEVREMGSYPVNAHDDECARTIKNQYHFTSICNMERQGTFGASGVVNVKKLSGSGFEEKEVKIDIDERFNGFLYEIDGEIYLIRIRKLTPKECWLLMNFSQEDFKKAESVNSNTQLYKEAGNSIVRNCLVAIFGQMFEGKEEVYKQV